MMVTVYAGALALGAAGVFAFGMIAGVLLMRSIDRAHQKELEILTPPPLDRLVYGDTPVHSYWEHPQGEFKWVNEETHKIDETPPSTFWLWPVGLVMVGLIIWGVIQLCS